MGQVKPQQGNTIGGKLVHQSHSCTSPQIGVVIGAAWPVRALEGDVIVADGIAAHHHRAVVLADLERHMPGRMARGRMGHHARQDFLAAVEKADLLFDQRQTPRRAHGKGCAGLADAVHRVGIGPIVPLVTRHHQPGLGKDRLVEIIQHPPQMIGMSMGEHHMGDVLGRQPFGRKTVQQPPGGWHEARPRTRVEQHHPILIAQQRQVAGRLKLIARHVVLVEDRRQLILGQSGEKKRGRQDQMPVAEADHLGRTQRQHAARKGRQGDAAKGKPAQTC